jgi:hypothetical protein
MCLYQRTSMKHWIVTTIATAGICLSLQSAPGKIRWSLATAAESSETPADTLAPAQFTVENVTIAVTFSPGSVELSRSQLLDWITVSARGVARYYGQFPVSHVRVLLTLEKGAGVRSGTTRGGQDPFIKIWLGQFTEAEMLRRDWVMTHEMVHLAFPNVPDTHQWLEEGLATYVEPLARLGVGQVRAEKVWQDLVEGLPHGLPRPGDQGLDYTHTWGRTYWGGALFCLLADLEIRQRTVNTRGLQDALRAIVAAGGTMAVAWSLPRALQVGDQAVGVPVLIDLYERMKARPVEINLVDLWQRLGVEGRGDTVVLHDDAPLAAVRRAITTAAQEEGQLRKDETQQGEK